MCAFSDVLGGQQRLSGAAQLRRNLRGSELRADVAVNQVCGGRGGRSGGERRKGSLGYQV